MAPSTTKPTGETSPTPTAASTAARPARIGAAFASSHLDLPVADEARARHVEMILARVDSLPTLGPIASRLLEMSSNDGIEVSELTTLIESDPAMASKILGLCRRAEKGLGDKVTSVKRAVVMLGIEPIRAAALSVAVFDLMRPTPEDDAEPAPGAPDPVRFDRVGFWKHLVAVACAGELLAASVPRIKVKPEEAFVAGLLHGIGKPVLEMVLPRSYTKVLALAERHGVDSAPMERGVIGLDHHTAGKRLGEHWGLPRDLRDVMWMYGQANDSLPEGSAGALIGVVTLAKAVVRQLHLGWCGDFGPIPEPKAIWKQLNLGTGAEGALDEKIVRKLHEAVADRLTLLGIADERSGSTLPSVLLLESLGAANRQLARINGTLEHQGRQGQASAKVLEAITTFQEHAAKTIGIEDTALAIGLSAASVLGAGPSAVLWRTRLGAAWELLRISRDGHPGRIERLRETGGTLAELTARLPNDVRSMRVVPLTHGASPVDDALGILLHAASFAEARLSAPAGHALGAAWASAILGAIREYELQRLGERLAENNRGLASMQSTLTRAQSLERLGEMTAGAAHEMNNPLTVISGHCQLLGSRLRDPKDRAAVAAIIGAAEQLTELVKSLHLVATPPTANPSTVDLEWAVGEAVKVARKQAHRDIPTELRITGVPTIVKLDPVLFADAVAELLRNAAEADPQGTIQIEATIDALEDRLQITVVDHGPGFSEKALDHAFDAFFSDRQAGRGRGLGLTRARSLAEAMSGKITIKSTPGEGARVTLAVSGWRAALQPADVREKARKAA